MLPFSTIVDTQSIHSSPFKFVSSATLRTAYRTKPLRSTSALTTNRTKLHVANDVDTDLWIQNKRNGLLKVEKGMVSDFTDETKSNPKRKTYSFVLVSISSIVQSINRFAVMHQSTQAYCHCKTKANS